MVAVRIPGSESIDNVAPARDPGVTANPNEFGAQIGTSLEHLGNAATSVGAHLDHQRNLAAGAMALPEAEAKMRLAVANRQIASRTQTWDSAEQAGRDFDGSTLTEQQKIVDETRQKYRLDDKTTEKLYGHLTGIRGHGVVGAVTEANNGIVTGLTNQHSETVKTIGATAMATGDVDGALKQVDQSVAALRGVVPQSEIDKISVASKAKVVESVVNGLRASGTKESLDRADALTRRFFGSVPSSATTSATPGTPTDIYGAIYGQESGSGRNPATSIDGARGGMQIIPSTFKQYARPGENIDNKADNLAVGRRIIDDLSAKTGGDPARIAVGYFSGPGNIAPPGSPTPWIEDKEDGNHKRVSSYVSDVVKRLGGSGNANTTKAELPDPDKALFWNSQINLTRTKNTAAASLEAENAYKRQIVDSAIGAPLPPRSSIEGDARLSEDTRNQLLAQHDSANADFLKLQVMMQKFTDPNGGDYNPFNKDDRAGANKIYGVLAADGDSLKALQTVVNRTGMVPEDAGKALHGALISNDPTKVATAMTVANNLMAKNPNAIGVLEGGAEIEKAATSFDYYVNQRGLSADAAARRVIEEQTPEYKSDRAKIKREDLDQIVKKSLDITDITKEFNNTWTGTFTAGLLGRPAVEFSVEARAAAYKEYAEVFREHYLQGNGDIAKAKNDALHELKKTWNVTNVSGSPTVVRYPPEHAPVYSNVPDASEQIAMQAQDAIAKYTNPAYRGRDFVAPTLKETVTETPKPNAISDALGLTQPASITRQRTEFDKIPSRGMTSPGNIDITKTPIVKNADGSISTVYSMSANFDGKEVLIPTVSADGKRVLNEQDAKAQYRKTGRNLGTFDTPENATKYAQALHEQQQMQSDAASQKAASEIIPRDKIMLTPLSKGQTASAYKNGDPVPYEITWWDKNGHLQTLKPGQAFVPDTLAMHAKVTEQRRVDMAKNTYPASSTATTKRREAKEGAQLERETTAAGYESDTKVAGGAAGTNTNIVIP